MSKLRDAAQQALEALEWADNAMYEGTPIQANTQKAITALRTALAEQPAEQESVQDEYNRVINHAIEQGIEASVFLRCWQEGHWSGCAEFGFEPNMAAYTAPQPAKQSLTDEEIGQVRWQCRWNRMSTDDNVVYATTQQLDAFASAIIAAYERKNGGQP